MAVTRPVLSRRSERRVLVTTRRLAVAAVVAAVTAAVGLLPASAAPESPATSSEAAALVAARAQALEKVTEQFNDAREQLRTAQARVDAATATRAAARAELAEAQQQVRLIARSAYTSEGFGGFRAMLTSRSADEFVDRLATLETIAGHHDDVLDRAASAGDTADRARAAAERATAEARALLAAASAARTKLQSEIAEYQAAFEALSARERRAAIEAAGAYGENRASRGERADVAPAGPVVASSQAAQIAVDTALAQRGKPYVWGAAGPDAFDCSGLVQFAYAAAGVGLPHSSALQATMGRPVTREELQPGDLVAFYSPVSHIGIYIGNGQMVHAPTYGDVVKVAGIDAVGSITAMRRIAA